MLEQVTGMRRVTSFLFLASVFCVTFEKVHWTFAGTVSLADVLAILFLVAFVLGTRQLARAADDGGRCSASSRPSCVVYLAGYFDLVGSDALGAVDEGPDQVADPLPVPRGRGRLAVAARAARTSGGRSAGSRAGIVVQRALRRPPAARRAARRQPRRVDPLADHRRREPDQHLRRDQRRERLPAERADRRPEPPRDHADRPAARPDAALPAARDGVTARGAG